MKLTKKEKEQIKNVIMNRYSKYLSFSTTVMRYEDIIREREKIVWEDAFVNPSVTPILDFLKTIYTPEIVESLTYTEYAPGGILNRFQFNHGSLRIQFAFNVMPENANKLHQLKLIEDNSKHFYRDFEDLKDNFDTCYEKAESKTYPKSMKREEIIDLIIESMWKSFMKKTDYYLKEA